MKPGEQIITGPQGRLQVSVQGDLEAPAFVAIICHPHPLYGGTMDNKVITTLARLARDRQALAVRFNFRGVGSSEGSYSEGIGETEDLLAVHAWLRHQYPDLPLWLAGFSFGSYVAAHGAEILAANGAPAQELLLVAPPVHHYPFAEIEQVGCPVTVAQGEEDEVVPAEQVYAWAESTPLQPDVVRFPETSHFFHGKLTDLKALAASHLPG